jgi:hypothetical protein
MQQRAWEYLVGLLSPLERNNGWQLAEAAAHTTPYSMQHLLDRAPWDAEAVRDDLVDYVAVELGDPDGVLVVRTLNKRTHPKGDGDSRLGGMTSIVFDLDEAGVMLSSPEPAAAPVAPRRRPLCIGSQNSYLRLRTKMGSQPGSPPPTVLRSYLPVSARYKSFGSYIETKYVRQVNTEKWRMKVQPAWIPGESQ